MSDQHPSDLGPAFTPMSAEAVMGTAETARKRRRWGILAAGLVVVVAVLGAVVLLAPRPVTVDGVTVWVPRGATIATLQARGLLAGSPGALLSVKGALLRKDGGGPPSVRVDGQPATGATPVSIGDTVSSVRGADVVESTTTVTTETAPPVQFLGSGPVESVEESGTPGTAEMVVGAVSGDVLSQRTISRGSPMTVRREPAYKGAKEVALTFDDGPWPGSTDAILSELTSAGVKATFFEIGKQVKGRPEISKRVLAAGMEIGTHSYSHVYLTRSVSNKVVTQEISWGVSTIQSALGFRPIWYRPAGGDVNAFVFREARRLGLRIVLWTIDPHDYQRPGVGVIARRVLNNVRPGSVILMHDGGGDRSQTVAALAIILKALKARGYTPVTLSRLYRLPGSTP